MNYIPTIQSEYLFIIFWGIMKECANSKQTCFRKICFMISEENVQIGFYLAGVLQTVLHIRVFYFDIFDETL